MHNASPTSISTHKHSLGGVCVFVCAFGLDYSASVTELTVLQTMMEGVGEKQGKTKIAIVCTRAYLCMCVIVRVCLWVGGC